METGEVTPGKFLSVIIFISLPGVIFHDLKINSLPLNINISTKII